MTLERYLADISDPSRPLKQTVLASLSGLAPEEMEIIQRVWPTIPLERRRQILQRLADMAEERVEMDFTPLFRLALKDPDPQVRAQAVHGLWECEDRSLITPLLHLLKCDTSSEVRAAVAQRLGTFASMASENKLPSSEGKRILDALVAAFRNAREEVEVRCRALESLAVFPDMIVHDLIRQAYDSAESRLRRSAVYAMGRNGDGQWKAIITRELSSTDPAMRKEAVGACAELGEESLVVHLLPLLQDTDPEVRLTTIHALGAIGGTLAKKTLLTLVKSSDETVREAAQEALERLRAEENPLTYKFRTS
ncbi:MAG: HEAT repeat domain-containing protein [Dehalococcoidia bacterium]|nr:HEAT repeat domain-containing protein [Dehalococcoidia bacterium]MDW8119497.1 HEAT repeat domain-containing protein [Chloroflexota bacterium]